MVRRLTAVSLLWLPLIFAADVKAVPEFPGAIEADNVRLTLRGVSLLKVGVIFRVYWAALYVEDGVPTGRVLDDVAKRLEIYYLRPIRAKDIVKTGNQILRRQLTEDEWRAVRDRVEAINRFYRDVRAGDRYTLTYVPGRGSTLSFNGQPIGVIEGADFARAYFGIWLDPRTDFPEFRERLLAR